MGVALVIPDISFEEKNLGTVFIANPASEYPKAGLTFMVDMHENAAIAEEGKLFDTVGNAVFNYENATVEGDSLIVDTDEDNSIVSDAKCSLFDGIGTGDFTVVVGYNFSFDVQSPESIGSEWVLLQTGSTSTKPSDRKGRASLQILRSDRTLNLSIFDYNNASWMNYFSQEPIIEGFNLSIVTRTNGIFNLYNNGKLVGSFEDVNNIELVDNNNFASIFCQSTAGSANTSKFFNGIFYTASVYNRALSSEEILSANYYYSGLYNS